MPRPVPARVVLLVCAALLASCSAASPGASTADATVDPVLPALPTASAATPPAAAGAVDGAAATAAPTATAAPPESAASADVASPTAPSAAPSDDPVDPDPGASTLRLEPVATLAAPTAMAVRPGDATLYVAERAGRVLPLLPDGGVGAPILDITSRTTTNGERGLLGITWSAAGDVLYTSSSDGEGATLLEAFDVVDGAIDADGRVLLRVAQPASNHNGGDVHIGPDGMLWLALGDGGGAGDRFGQGQRPDTLLAAMLRIDPDGGDPYAVPAGNNPGPPFAPEVWAYGLRNPWRFSFDAETGDLWIADVGQNAVEEVNRVAPGEGGGLNFGWPRLEGDRPFDGRAPDGPTVAPLHTYSHARGCSITGGYVYRGSRIPTLQGAYLYSDYCDGRIFALDLAADGRLEGDVDTGLVVDRPVSFGQGPDGELYVLSLNGDVLRIMGR